MKKKELRALAERYGMEILRNPVTSEAFGVMVDSEDLIPELDALAESRKPLTPCAATRELVAGTTYRYKIVTTPAWFDLWGWAEAGSDDDE